MNKSNIEHPTSNAEHRTWGGAGIRMKTPNPKIQIPKKLQYRGIEAPVGVWSLGFLWSLVFGIRDLACDRQRTTDH